MKTACCPICKSELDENNDGIKFCRICLREFWPIKSDQQQTNLESDQYDLEVASQESGGAEGPVLLCDDSDLKTWPKNYINKNRKKDYLAEHFPNSKIETREYQPY